MILKEQKFVMTVLLALMLSVIFLKPLYALDTKSPLEVTIHMEKEEFKLDEAVQGTIVVENTYPVHLPAIFTIKLFHNDVLIAQRLTSVKLLLPGKTEFSLKNFGVPYIGKSKDSIGTWRLWIAQKSYDNPREVTFRILSSISNHL